MSLIFNIKSRTYYLNKQITYNNSVLIKDLNNDVINDITILNDKKEDFINYFFHLLQNNFVSKLPLNYDYLYDTYEMLDYFKCYDHMKKFKNSYLEFINSLQKLNSKIVISSYWLYKIYDLISLDKIFHDNIIIDQEYLNINSEIEKLLELNYYDDYLLLFGFWSKLMNDNYKLIDFKKIQKYLTYQIPKNISINYEYNIFKNNEPIININEFTNNLKKYSYNLLNYDFKWNHILLLGDFLLKCLLTKNINFEQVDIDLWTYNLDTIKYIINYFKKNILYIALDHNIIILFTNNINIKIIYQDVKPTINNLQIYYNGQEILGSIQSIYNLRYMYINNLTQWQDWQLYKMYLRGFSFDKKINLNNYIKKQINKYYNPTGNKLRDLYLINLLFEPQYLDSQYSEEILNKLKINKSENILIEGEIKYYDNTIFHLHPYNESLQLLKQINDKLIITRLKNPYYNGENNKYIYEIPSHLKKQAEYYIVFNYQNTKIINQQDENTELKNTIAQINLNINNYNINYIKLLPPYYKKNNLLIKKLINKKPKIIYNTIQTQTDILKCDASTHTFISTKNKSIQTRYFYDDVIIEKMNKHQYQEFMGEIVIEQNTKSIIKKYITKILNNIIFIHQTNYQFCNKIVYDIINTSNQIYSDDYQFCYTIINEIINNLQDDYSSINEDFEYENLDDEFDLFLYNFRKDVGQTTNKKTDIKYTNINETLEILNDDIDSYYYLEEL